jgi:hypothetical protein
MALGTPSRPVVFTSIKDDLFGGDTNNASGSPADGDWKELRNVDGIFSVTSGIVQFDGGCGASDSGDNDAVPDATEDVVGTNPTAIDTDGDGCSDAEELGGRPSLGGQRDASSAWDFFDVPVAAGPAVGANGQQILTPSSVKNRAVALTDVGVVLVYVGRPASSPDYIADNNLDGKPDGQQLDRTPSPEPLAPWRSGPPNGAVSLQDVGVALAQVGHSCIAAPN